ncbi:Fe-S cluster assembly protein HesB [Modestobacter sp. VKM Ac-2983]|uniref:HesB/IscA family protein n=1 Tax=Modestobacter sp. VKM Ac-2983 TaxID=3004137 RepID=UPI0022AB8542|nr:Fe-S cluster assembly protein HesB [Modestobacter sp. VKM Ac-2983]MCZ2804909.1 Fe-S cluster assembly protein HesB [Modestobacter sp. VKM Ac-2983]
MLTLTPQAATAIRGILDQSETPEQGGLRIANDPTAQSLALSLAAVPAEDDQVLDQSGARVFLDEKAATVLDDKVLDAQPDPTGKVQFGIAESGV